MFSTYHRNMMETEQSKHGEAVKGEMAEKYGGKVLGAATTLATGNPIAGTAVREGVNLAAASGPKEARSALFVVADILTLGFFSANAAAECKHRDEQS
jgi:hypothetical protein